MSWGDHVNTLMSGPSMKYAGIFGKDGNKWATSADFNPDINEVKQLVRLASGDPLGPDERITVCGQKYLYKEKPDDGLFSVLSIGGAEKYSCTVCLTKTGVLIGISLAPAAGQSRQHLDIHKTYLIGQNM